MWMTLLPGVLLYTGSLKRYLLTLLIRCVGRNDRGPCAGLINIIGTMMIRMIRCYFVSWYKCSALGFVGKVRV